GTALLLAAVDPVGKLIIGDHVVELGGRLVVPGTPSFAAVDSDDRSLVGRDEENVRIVRADPDSVIIVAAWRALEAGESLAGVGRTVESHVGDVDDVLAVWRDVVLCEIAAATPKARIGVDSQP